MKENLKIAVIGAGVVGLSTALVAQNTFHNASITVLAQDFFNETTSEVAAGYYVPDNDRSRHGTNPVTNASYNELYEQWSKDSGSNYRSLAVSSEGFTAGIGISPFYELMEQTRTEKPNYADHVFSFSIMPKDEIDQLFPKAHLYNVKSGFHSVTCYIENQYYLPYIMNKLNRSSSFQVQKTALAALTDVTDDYDLVFNCSGIGARSLVSDLEMYPIRGQVLRVKAPWMTFSFYGPQSTYAFVNRNEVVIGGTHDSDSWDLSEDNLQTHEFMRRVMDFVPSLRHAKPVCTRVGLRPGRKSGVRVEIDSTRNRERSIVVHNYGHGAEGVGLSWGTAVHAVKLAREELRMSAKL